MATQAAIGIGLTVRAVPPATVAADAGGFVVELADVATSRAETAPDLALGEEQRAQTAVAASEAPPPVTPSPPPHATKRTRLAPRERDSPKTSCLRICRRKRKQTRSQAAKPRNNLRSPKLARARPPTCRLRCEQGLIVPASKPRRRLSSRPDLSRRLSKSGPMGFCVFVFPWIMY